MNSFDKYIKDRARREQIEVPFSVKEKIELTLEGLPEEKSNIKHSRRVPTRALAAAACVVFTLIFLLPNLSVTYARALEKIPVIGSIVRVVTIRSYFYSDDYHEMDIDVPMIADENSEAFNKLNADVKELTDTLVNQFYKELEEIGDMGHSAVYVDHETQTNTENWFTLKLCVNEAAGSGNTYYKYYHINKLTGETVALGDIATGEEFYDAVESDIKRQMQERMEKDSSLTYWTEESELGDDLLTIDAEHNFYWNSRGELVIPFDKYEISPGYMGTPEFTVSREVLKGVVKNEILDAVKP